MNKVLETLQNNVDKEVRVRVEGLHHTIVFRALLFPPLSKESPLFRLSSRDRTEGFGNFDARAVGLIETRPEGITIVLEDPVQD